jgi:TolA-binding protein
MKRLSRYINGKKMATIRKIDGNGFDDDKMADSNDSALFDNISGYMKGLADLEDVNNDPDLFKTREAVNKMVTEYHKNVSVNKDNEKFIRDIFSERSQEENMIDEISKIKLEIRDNKLDEITAGWIKEWNEKRERNEAGNPQSDEIRNFVTGSMNPAENEPVKLINTLKQKGSDRTLYVRYASLAAAAIIGAVLLIRSLLPSNDPEKLFNSYYQPFDAISPVTRSINNNETGSYSSAVGNYKSGDYQKAALGFSEATGKDPSIVSPRFFLGLTQLALGNNEQAVNLLSGVVNASGEYGKEARWYLGLTYLKTGNKPKAAECFEYLSQSQGFYHDRSVKILRRLK